MREPAVVLSDYALAVECAILAWRSDRASPLGRSATALFAATAVATLAGGTAHGFRIGADACWRVALFATGLAAFAACRAGARLVATASAAVIPSAAAIGLVAYAAAVLAGVEAFGFAIGAYLAASLVLLAGFTRAGARAGLAGIAATFAGAGLQQCRVGIPALGLDHNAVFHVVQGVALAALFFGFRRLEGRDLMLTRRDVLIGAGALAAGATAREPAASERGHRSPTSAGARDVDDVHSQMNRTRVRGVLEPASIGDVQRAIALARRERSAVSIAGGRHAMGGQQFAEDALLLDMRRMRRVLALDAERGIVDVEAGIEWPDLIADLVRMQAGYAAPWSIVQKQTGADRLTLGGALAANVHGRGLRYRPIVQDVESFTLVDAAGDVVTCDRTRNHELFRLVIGGYGLFGVVTSVRLRLAPRRKVRRVVEVRTADTLPAAFAARIADGFEYGDFQFCTDPASDDFLRTGVLSCYRPVAADTPVPAAQRELHAGDWAELLYLAHADKRRAFELYRDHYLATDGQIYWSDEHQLGVYLDDYHRALDRRLGSAVRGTEMIAEVYVPRPLLPDLLADMRDDFRRHGVDLIYGSVRLIERDDETALAWAREPWACVVMNLHVAHTTAGVAHAADAFRRVIDMAAARGGTYYLTYHRWATPAQVARCHPALPDCLRRKRAYDPAERFQSEWYRHYRAMFGI